MAQTNTFVLVEHFYRAYSIKTCIIQSIYLEIFLIFAIQLGCSFEASENPAFGLKKI